MKCEKRCSMLYKKMIWVITGKTAKKNEACHSQKAIFDKGSYRERFASPTYGLQSNNSIILEPNDISIFHDPKNSRLPLPYLFVIAISSELALRCHQSVWKQPRKKSDIEWINEAYDRIEAPYSFNTNSVKPARQGMCM